MSNKVVPLIYRQIIDDVISNIKTEFDDYGVSEDILSDLQSRWETKVIASNVAEFESAGPASSQPPGHPHYPPHVMQHPSLPPIHAGFPQYAPSPTHTPVKSEPLENRFPLQNNGPTYMPTLPGPTLPGPPRPSQTPATVSHHHYNGGPPRPQQPYSSSTSLAPGATSAHQRMPQVDGPSESDSDSATPPPPSQSFAPPRSLHPSLPQPGVGPTTTASEEINSDLDDSDSDAEEEDQEGALGETDIVFCTYDKVARVKNKWKCVLKDGMIHINGKDYLFAKCTCEFEW